MDAIQQIEILHLYISPAHNFKQHEAGQPGATEAVDVERVECVAGQGLRGDRYFGYREDYKGQITFFDVAVYEKLQAAVGAEFSPQAMRRNVLVRGLDLAALVGVEFELGGVRMRGSEHCKPCFWMDDVCGPGAEAFLTPNCRGGLRARILSDGWLTKGLLELRQ